MTEPEKSWRPADNPAPGMYFDTAPPQRNWSWKFPAWMTADWPEADEMDANESWWPTVAICVMALALVLASLQPWAWHQ